VCLAVSCLYVGSIYAGPLVAQRVPFFSRAGETWPKIFATFAVSLLSLLVARFCLGAVPLPKPNCLTTSQVLGVSPDIDSVWWDFLLPILITLCMLAPLMLSNVLTAMMSHGAGKLAGQGFWSLLLWYVSRHIPSLVLAVLASLVTLDAGKHQALIFVQELHATQLTGILGSAGGRAYIQSVHADDSPHDRRLVCLACQSPSRAPV
jgi:hypothetical protein